MNGSRLERLAPLTGVLAVALVLVGAGLFGVYDYLPSAESLADYFNDNSNRVYWAGYIGLIATFPMLWFAGSLYSAFRDQEGGSGRLSMVSFGAGLATALAIAAGFTAMLASGARAGAEGGITSVEAVTLYDYYGQILGGVVAVTLAVLIAATGVLAIRKALFPNWFGWLSLLIALLLLTPIAYIVLAAAMLWLVVVSIWLYRRAQPAA